MIASVTDHFNRKKEKEQKSKSFDTLKSWAGLMGNSGLPISKGDAISSFES